MSPPTRRALLRSGLLLTGGVIAGCSGFGPFGSDSPPDLEPGASIVSQPSDESPAVVELSLTNTGGEVAPVYPREPGSFVFHLVPPFREQQGDIFMFPQDTRSVHLQQGTFERVGGCWRVVDTSEDDERGPYLAGQSLPKETRIEPDETHTVRHDAYFHGPASDCFPVGVYQTDLGIEIRNDEERQIDLIYTLEVLPADELTISVVSERGSRQSPTSTNVVT